MREPIELSRRPTHFDRFDGITPAEPEMEPGIGGGLKAPSAIRCRICFLSARENRDRSSDAIPIGRGPFESEM